MRLTLQNLTLTDILCRHGDTANVLDGHLTVLSSSTTTTDLPEHYSNLTLSIASHPEIKQETKQEAWTIYPNSLAIQFTMALSASWRAIAAPPDCPWRIYCNRVSRNHHTVLVFPRRHMANFLSDIPDSVPLSSVLLPGTHDSLAFYGWPISQCQSLSRPLAIQLQTGIRVLDVRLAVIKSRLIVYHGSYPQRTPFQHILATLHAFLHAPDTCRETIVMSIKQEDFTTTSAQSFSKLVHEEIFSGPGGVDMWFLKNRIPTLGEVRGKVIMFSRFGGDGSGWEDGLEGLGIHPTIWPDSEKYGFSWDCKNTLVRTHDWYDVPSFLSIPEKVSLATEILLPPANNPPMPSLGITFFSAASFPLAVPPTMAQGFGWPKWGLGVEGVNSRIGKWLLDILSGSTHLAFDERERDLEKNEADSGAEYKEQRIRGWVFMDFYEEPDDAIVPLLVECNFRGRIPGQEGW